MVYTGKAEVGQNIRTSLTQVVAEELHAAPGSIEMVMADTERTPFDMGTFGSRTTPSMSPQLRRAAAAAREMLIDLAAERWKIDRSVVATADGAVVNTQTHESIAFGKLTEGKKLTKAVTDEMPLTPTANWSCAGHSSAKVQGHAFVTGKHQYASDIRLPGMLHGKVLRRPSYGATLVSVNLDKAKSMAGVAVVRDGDFVGVAAPSEHLAAQALQAIHAEWQPGPPISAKTLFDDLRKPDGAGRSGGEQRGGRGGGSSNRGSIKAGLDAADVRLEQTYTVAYIAHAPLEPRAAVAQWEGGKLTVWTGTQRPFGVRGELVDAFGLSDSTVRVIVPDTGAGYGGKHTGEAAVEAARLARAAVKPVKLVWTREEEFTWAYFRPAGVIEVKSGASAMDRSPPGSVTTTIPVVQALSRPMRYRTTWRRFTPRDRPCAMAPTEPWLRQPTTSRAVEHGRARPQARYRSTAVPPHEPQEPAHAGCPRSVCGSLRVGQEARRGPRNRHRGWFREGGLYRDVRFGPRQPLERPR